MSATRLTRLHVERAPGLPDGLPALDLDPGLTIVLGPNASGKSTLARVLRDLLWPTRLSTVDRVTASWTSAGEPLTADLVAGRVTWSPGPPTVPPGGAELAAFGMGSLLQAGAAADGSIAAEIARQLAGGIDLAAAAKGLGSSERFGATSNLARTREAARTGLAGVEREARELAARERELGAVEERLEAARGARDDHGACLAFLARLDAEAAVAAARTELAAFPGSLADLRGDEAEELAGLETQRTAKAAERDGLQRSQDDLDERLTRDPLGEAPPDPVELDAWERRLDGLAERARRAGELEEDLAAAEATAAEARSLLAVDDAAAAGLGAEGLDALAVAQQEERAARARAAGAREASALWRGWSEGADADTEPTAEAVRALRAWLRAPEAVAGDRQEETGGLDAGSWAWVRVRVLLALVLAVLVAVGLFLDLGTTGVGNGVAGSSIAVLLAFVLWKAGRDAARAPGVAADVDAAADRGARERAVEAARATGRLGDLDADGWTAERVTARLAELERELADAAAARRAADRAQAADVARDEAEAAADRQAASLAERLAAAGLAEGVTGLGAVEQAWALRRLRGAEAAAAAARAARDEAHGAVAAGLADFGGFLAPFLKEGAAPPADLDAARAAWADLARRAADRAESRERRDRNGRQLAGLVADLEALAARADGLWKRADLDPTEPGAAAALDRLLARRDDFEAARGALAAAEDHLRRRADEAAAAGAPSHLSGLDDPEAVTRAQVEAWAEADRDAAETFGALSEERGAIQEALQGARGGSRYVDAIAASRAAEAEVAEERDRAAEDAVARMLLDDLRTGHESEHAPRLLERARERFAGFVDQRWRLELDADQRFALRDAAGGGLLALEELSDGTRVQLLLAARLTALEELEGRGRPLPIALDEALATSDPRRFRAVAEAVFQVADEGRQVLYLTADPSEAEQWRAAARALGRPEPACIDLGHLRGEGADWAGAVPAEPPAPLVLPDPTGQSPAAFAASLGAPAPDGFAEPGAWHLYLATFDDLEALVDCLHRRIETLGHWSAAHAAGELAAGIDATRAGLVEARADLAEAFAPLWRIGRGRPVTWSDVEASGAVSDRFEPEVRDALERHGRDPVAFVEAVDAIKGFFAKNKARIRGTLEERGCLPAAEPFEPAELIRRTLAAAPEATAALGDPAAVAYVTWLADLVEGAEAE